jgi:hypothetical protein
MLLTKDPHINYVRGIHNRSEPSQKYASRTCKDYYLIIDEDNVWQGWSHKFLFGMPDFIIKNINTYGRAHTYT